MLRVCGPGEKVKISIQRNPEEKSPGKQKTNQISEATGVVHQYCSTKYSKLWQKLSWGVKLHYDCVLPLNHEISNHAKCLHTCAMQQLTAD